VEELRPGLWWWEVVHPEWTDEDAETQDWGPEVSSYAIEDGTRLVLIDPTDPPSPVAELAGERDVVIVLTCSWHARDTPKLVERYGATVQSPDAAGFQAFPGLEPEDLVLWIESRRALVAGDTFIDRGNGFEFPRDWANKGVPAEEILATLQHLRTLPVELVLPTHGKPTDRAALERALA
jgi:hypothetical protein